MSTRPLQVFLDERDREQLDAWSKQRGWTKSDAIRVAIRALVNATDPDSDPLLSGSGMIRGLPADASSSFDRYLAETFLARPITTRSPSGRTKTSRSRLAKPRVRR